MVSHLLPLAAVIAMAATPVAAQTRVDWRPAGGDLFVGVVPEAPAPEAAGLEAVRLADLDQPFADAIAEARIAAAGEEKLRNAA